MMAGMSDEPRSDVAEALHDLQERVAELERRVDNERRRVGAHDRDLARIGPQVAALEERVEALRERLEPPAVATAAEADQARSLLDDVRREHARVRVRVTSLTRYEERIRQLEDAVAVLGEGRVQSAPKK